MQSWVPFLNFILLFKAQFSSVAQLCPTLCNPMGCSRPGLPIHDQFPEFTQTHAHWVSDAIQPSWTQHVIYQSWIFIGRTDAEAETPILWQPDVKNWLIGKDPDAGKDWRWEEKGMREGEIVGWHHPLNGHESE